MKDYRFIKDVTVDRKNIFDQPVTSDMGTYDSIRKIARR